MTVDLMTAAFRLEGSPFATHPPRPQDDDAAASHLDCPDATTAAIAEEGVWRAMVRRLRGQRDGRPAGAN